MTRAEGSPRRTRSDALRGTDVMSERPLFGGGLAAPVLLALPVVVVLIGATGPSTSARGSWRYSSAASAMDGRSRPALARRVTASTGPSPPWTLTPSPVSPARLRSSKLALRRAATPSRRTSAIRHRPGALRSFGPGTSAESEAGKETVTAACCSKSPTWTHVGLPSATRRGRRRGGTV